jgi:hypothetical protein
MSRGAQPISIHAPPSSNVARGDRERDGSGATHAMATMAATIRAPIAPGTSAAAQPRSGWRRASAFSATRSAGPSTSGPRATACGSSGSASGCHSRPPSTGWTSAHSTVTSISGQARRSAAAGRRPATSTSAAIASGASTAEVSLLSRARASVSVAGARRPDSHSCTVRTANSSIHSSCTPAIHSSGTPQAASPAMPATATPAARAPARRRTSA